MRRLLVLVVVVMAYAVTTYSQRVAPIYDTLYTLVDSRDMSCLEVVLDEANSLFLIDGEEYMFFYAVPSIYIREEKELEVREFLLSSLENHSIISWIEYRYANGILDKIGVMNRVVLNYNGFPRPIIKSDRWELYPWPDD